ncbi:MAG: hypothetical protein QOG77_2182, partial [Solirubrobacteraceae bacterium]|nr:hypothetical protein [Solirubrobacteraceae bacterium]
VVQPIAMPVDEAEAAALAEERFAAWRAVVSAVGAG